MPDNIYANYKQEQLNCCSFINCIKKIFIFFCFVFVAFAGNAQLTKEQQVIQKTFYSFLKFYKNNEKKFNSFQLYKGKGKDNSPPYKVQWAAAEKYFTYLRNNVPYVSEAYIKVEKEHFKYADSCFKANPTDEIPEGFDYDCWAGGQEDIAYTYKWHTSAKNKYIVTITGNTAILKIGSELDEGAEDKDRSWSVVSFTKENG